MNVIPATINDNAKALNNDNSNGIKTFNSFNAKKLNVVIGSRSKNAGKPTSNGSAKIAPISTIALTKCKMFFSNLSGRLTKATNANANLLNKLSPGRIVHSGNVRSVAPMLNRSNATCAKPLMNVIPHNNPEVNNCANNGNPSHRAGKIKNCVVKNLLMKISGVNKLIVNGTPINANKSFNTFDAKYAVTNERTLQINLPRTLFNRPANASGKPIRPAINAAGTVNKFNPGTNAVKNPLRTIGNKNNGASNMNGSPPNNARNNPTKNATIAAGIKLIKPLKKKITGNEISLRANFVKYVPINVTSGKLIHVNGFKNANGPNTGAKSSKPARNTKNGTVKSIIVSINIISGKPINKFNTERTIVTNGAKKIVSIIKLKNGMKLGNANSANAINGSLIDNNNNPSNATNPSAESAKMNGSANAFNRPRPANTIG